MKKVKIAFTVAALMAVLFGCKKDCPVCEECEKPVCEECEEIVNLKSGLLAHYKFDGNVGDSSGNNNHGTIFGNLSFTTDKAGTANSAANFDGVDDYVIANEAGNLSPAAITISAYYNTSSTDIQNLLCKRKSYNAAGEGSNVGLSWSVNARSGVFSGFNNAQFGVTANTGTTCEQSVGINESDVVYSLQTIEPNTWYHIVCIFENGNQRIYINGKIRQATMRPFSNLKQCAGGQLVIGAFIQGFPAFFKGKMDDVRIYSRALNEEEIKELAKGY